MVWLVFFWPLPADGVPAAGPLAVVARALKPVVYVGEPADLIVTVVSDGGPVAVAAPVVEWADVRAAGSVRRPVAGGKFRDEYKFRVVPRRAGAVVVPSVQARGGGRRGASLPLRFQVRDVPRDGRPAGFLGGVGRFEVAATLAPSEVGAGGFVTYRVAVSGPGALGIRSAPALERLARLPLGLRVERLPDEVTDEPPARVFVYRLRPGRAGEAVVPPVTVAAFDPASGRFATRATAGLRLRVTPRPAFAVGSLRYGPAVPASGSAAGLGRWAAAALGLVLLGGAALGVRKLWRAPAVRRRRRLAAWGRRLSRAAGDVEAAGMIHDALAEYLALTRGRPTGALTPVEVREGLAVVTGSPELGEAAGALLARCDRARFGPAAPDLALRADGLALLGALRAPLRKARRGRPPRA